MSDARKRKLQSSLSHSTTLPESLRFVPSTEAPTNGPHLKKQRLASSTTTPSTDYAAGLLKLQSEQLLKSCRPHDKPDDNLDKLVASLQKQIQAIPDHGPSKLSEVREECRTSGVAIDFLSEPPEDLQLNFEYSEPAEITIGGLGSLNMCPRTMKVEAEMHLELPSAIIQEKDYLNHRIHYKLAFYLFTVARSLKSKYMISYDRRLIFGIERSVLVVEYKGRRVVITTDVPSGVLAETKLEPSKNADRSQEGSTPLYNSSILLLSRRISLVTKVETAAQASPSFRDAIILAHIYLSKRSLTIQADQWALMTALLLEGGGKNGGKVLSPNASSLQLFRGAVLFLSHHFANSSDSVSFGDAQFQPGCWTQGFNIFASLTDQHKILLASELGKTVDLLRDEDRNPIRAFDKTFLDVQTYIGSWDLEFRIADCVPMPDVERIWRTLNKALGARATIISVVQSPQHRKRSITAEDTSGEHSAIVIGMKLDSKYSQDGMVLGPPANAPDAKSFRGLWGSLAELRKFKDGKILESVLLSKLNPTLDACQKILHLHFPSLPMAESWTIYGADRPTERSEADRQKLLAAEFDEFARLARDLEGLPLRITSIWSAHPIFSQRSAHVPTSLDAVIQFESSARWPDDLEAIQRTKIAFLLAAKEPFSTLSGVKDVAVQIENQSSAIAQTNTGLIKNITSLKVEMTSGMVYRLRIHFDRELTLLRASLLSPVCKSDPTQVKAYRDALDLYDSTYHTNEIHSQAMRNMQSRFPVLSESTILLKKWFDAHLLYEKFSDRAIDLLSLNVHVNDAERNVQSPVAAFVEALRFLAHWDWRQDALLLSENLEEYKNHAKGFEKIKSQDPGHSIVLRGPYDLPSPEISRLAALRMSVLAKAASDTLQSGMDISTIMSTPLEHFDCVLSLNQPKVTKYKNLQAGKLSEEEYAQAFVQELGRIYGEALYLFSSSKASKVGILVDPALLQPRRFRPNLGYPTRPAESEEGQKVVIDLEVLFDEIARLGSGIIKHMHRKSSLR